MGGWSDTDNKANLGPASLYYASNEAELGKNEYSIAKGWQKSVMTANFLICEQLLHLVCTTIVRFCQAQPPAPT